MTVVLLNALPYSTDDGGFTTALDNIVQSLDKQDLYRILLIFPKKYINCKLISSIKKIDICEYAVPAKGKFLLPYFVLNDIAKKVNADIVHSEISGHFVKSRCNVITLHDLSFITYPTHNRDAYSYLLWNVLYPQSMKRATIVKVVSNCTLQDAIKFYPKNNYKLVWPKCNPIIKSGLQIRDWSIPLRILMVGSIIPRKNIGFAIRALEMADLDYTLDIVGKTSWGFMDIRELIDRNNRINFHNYIDDDALDLLYTNADLYISSSFYEGFGYPVVEALSHSCPVFLSNTSSYVDLVSDIYRFDLNYQNFLTKFSKLLVTKRSEVLNDQVIILDKFTEDNHIKAHLELYEYALSQYRRING